MNETSFAVTPISAEQAEDLRRRGGEVHIADAMPGFPCRRCLRDAEIGDELILVSHDPFELDSPYRSASPIFLHRTACEPTEGRGTVPLQLARRRLSVRSFDAGEMMIDAAVVDGDELEPTIARFFAEDAAERLHVHNADRGCWAATVTRAG